MSLAQSKSIRSFSRQVVVDYQINYWFILISIFFLAVVSVMLAINLETIAPFPAEAETANIVSRWPSFERIIGWPYYFISYCLNLIIDNALLASRLVSVWFGLVGVVSLWICLRYYYGTGLALMASGLLASNSWFLVVNSSAGPSSMIMATPILMMASWLIYSRRRHQLWVKFLLGFSLLLAWFIPFLIWLSAGMLVYLSRQFNFFKNKLTNQILTVVLISSLTWLTIGLSLNSTELLGLTGYVLDFNNLGQVLSAFVWQAPVWPDRWLADLPMLDVLGLTTLVVGLATSIVKMKSLDNDRKILIGLVVFAWFAFVAATGGLASSAFQISLGVIGLLIGCGLAEIYNRWRTTFPLNPLVQAIGLLTLGLLLSLSIFYQAQKHFIAWPRSLPTLELRQESLD